MRFQMISNFTMVYILLVFAIIDDDNLQRSWTDKVMGKKKINAFSMIFFAFRFVLSFFTVRLQKLHKNFIANFKRLEV